MNVEILSEKIFPVLELEQQLVFLLKRSSLATQHEQQDEEKKITTFHDTDDTKMAQSTLQQRIQEVNAYLTPSTSSSRDTTATTTTTTTTTTTATTTTTTAISIYLTSLLRTLSSNLSLSRPTALSSAKAPAIQVDHTNLTIATMRGIELSLRRINVSTCDSKLQSQILRSLPQLLTVVLEFLAPSLPLQQTTMEYKEHTNDREDHYHHHHHHHHYHHHQMKPSYWQPLLPSILY